MEIYSLDMLEILSNEIEEHRRVFFRKFIVLLVSLSIIIYLLIFIFFASIILSFQEMYFDEECKRKLVDNIRQISYGQYNLKIHKYTDQEKDFYDFCSTIWNFEDIQQTKLELTLNKTYITIAEIHLTYTYYSKGQRKTGTRFNGTIIKLKKKKNLSILPFTDYEIREYRGETYIIVYNPQKILEFSISRRISKEYLEQKIRDFILKLSYFS